MATRETLRTLARIRADQTDSTFPTDTEYNYLLDLAAREVWYDLLGAGWPLNFSVASLSLGSNPVTLGAGTVAAIRGVFYNSGGRWVELPRLNEGDRARYLSSTGTPAAYDVRIDPTNGAVVEVLPEQTSGTVRVEYISEYAGFASDAATWFGPARSDELIVLRAAAKGMRKEGNDQGAVQLDREYAMLFDTVTRLASWFNLRHATLIRDVGDPLAARRDDFDYEV